MEVKGKRVPLHKLKEFKKPVGKLIKENELHKIHNEKLLITVGDVVSLAVRKNGIIPSISVYDGMTERKEMTEFAVLAETLDEAKTVVSNPAGVITCELFNAVRNALTRKAGLIRVIGEEDLAVIPFILLSPDDTKIVYGWPGEGMMLITTSDIIRKKTEELWNMMEEFE